MPVLSSFNNDLSLHEEYLACLLECVLAGEVDSSKVRRRRIGALLDRKPLIVERLRNARSEIDGVPTWSVETERVRAVVLKLTRGHAAYELNEPQIDAPTYVHFKPLIAMDRAERETFEGSSDGVIAPWPEVGSRAMQRLIVVGSDAFAEGWLVVQEVNYRFHVSQTGGVTVQIVLREYFACEVAWE
jgi:hypothetical protein